MRRSRASGASDRQWTGSAHHATQFTRQRAGAAFKRGIGKNFVGLHREHRWGAK
jgi:hypothetical protein